MKVLSVCGISKSGKTTTIEHIIKGLTMRGYKVGSVKEIHFETFAIDPEPESNTFRHRQAGAGLVTARGYNETDVLFPAKLDMKKIFSFYEGFDYVVLEGVDDIPVPTIVTAHALEDLEQKWSEHVFCVSGKIAMELSQYGSVPAISATTDADALLDLIEQNVNDLADRSVELYIGERRIVMVPFVQNVLRGTILGVVKELNGYIDGAEIIIKLQ